MLWCQINVEAYRHELSWEPGFECSHVRTMGVTRGFLGWILGSQLSIEEDNWSEVNFRLKCNDGLDTGVSL